MSEAGENQLTKDDFPDVYALCVRTLYERIRLANALSPLGTMFLAWFEKDFVRLPVLIAWVVLISFFQAVTLWNIKRFQRHHVPNEKLRVWHLRQTILGGVEGMSWGSAVIFFHSEGGAALANDILVLTVVITMVCLSIFALAPSYRNFLSFTCGALWVPVVHYFWTGDMHTGPYIVGILTLQLALLKLGKVANDDFIEGARRLVLIQKISKQLEQRNQQLDRLNREINDIAIHDKLTGLYNRHFIVDQLEMQYSSYERYGHPCSIVMADIDYFKQVNDSYGHIVGDEVLAAFSRLMESMVRNGDLIGRYGGEEFLLVLPMTDLEAAKQLSQRIRSKLESAPLVERPEKLVITASFGVAQIRSGESMTDWLNRADTALYSAKESGRNCVME